VRGRGGGGGVPGRGGCARGRRCREPARARPEGGRRTGERREVRALLAHAASGERCGSSHAVQPLRGGGGMSDPRLRQALLVALAVVAVDQVTKTIVERSMTLYESIAVLPGFSLTYVPTAGAAFGLVAGAPPGSRLPLFLLVTAVAIWALVSYLRSTPSHRRALVWALGGILGGAVGNFICRMRYGEVVD